MKNYKVDVIVHYHARLHIIAESSKDAEELASIMMEEHMVVAPGFASEASRKKCDYMIMTSRATRDKR